MAWAGVIWVFSTDAFSGAGTGRHLTPLLEFLMPGAGDQTIRLAHVFVRKLGHVTEYAILAVLLLRAFRSPERGTRSAGLWTVGLCVAYAATDEIHQSFVASRTGAVSDVLLDTLGAVIGVGLAAWKGRRFSWGRRSPA